jgi:predicted dehydrogenase
MTAPAGTPAVARPLRFGLVGTGYWARVTHARALATTPGVELSAVWGRNLAAAQALAGEHDATAHADIDEFLADIDAVAFSVPPDVQNSIAIRAARAGKHLLLEKPVATSVAAAEQLAAAVADAKVATVVFFTARFEPGVREWLAEVTSSGGWAGGESRWLGSALVESSPFDSPWRHDKGGLWDLGPHALSLLWVSLGPVVSVTAVPGDADLSCLVLRHDSGATSTATLTLSAPAAAAGFDLSLWGEQGRWTAPPLAADPRTALRVALAELSENARTGRLTHPCDVRFGCDVTRVLATAEAQLART